jgi:glutathione S-transferase
MAARTPVLWQIKISHYNEKARWALDHKGIAHKRRSPLPLFGTLPTAWVLTRGTTLPVLRLEGRSIADSTQIIAALEERSPEPPLYPAPGAGRERALALEDSFDEQVAPHVRLLVWHETMQDPRSFMGTAMPDSGKVVRGGLRATLPITLRAVRRRYGITPERAREARERIMAGMRRVEAEMGSDGYLVGDSFTVADLSAAALFTPLLQPPQRPYLPQAAFPEPLRRFCDDLAEMPGAAWVFDMYRRHRGASAEVGARAEPVGPEADYGLYQRSM